MVLHMRKLTSVLIALIMMVSAAPVFADAEQEVASEEPAAAAEAAGSTEQEGSPAEEVSTSESNDKNSCEQNRQEGCTSTEEKEQWIEITLYDVDDKMLEERQKVVIEAGMSLEKALEKFNEEREYKIHWEECSFTINDKEETDIDIKEYQPASEDSIVIRVLPAPEVLAEEETEADNEEPGLGAVKPETLEAAYNSTEKKVKEIADKISWAFTSEWVVLGLSRAGKLSDADAKKYCDRIAAYIENTKSEKMNNSMSSDNSRLILSLTSIGIDPTDINGYNLLKPLSDINYVTKQGLNGPVWALIAFDSHNYDIPKAEPGVNQTTREELVNRILSAQRADGGWAYSGSSSDVDMTCMVLQALSPYNNGDNPAVQNAVNRALEWLKTVQKADGFFTDSSESHSQVIIALTSLGIDPASGEGGFVKNNNGALDALMSFYVSGGGFKHVEANWKLNSLATQQGYHAIAAYYRFKAGMTSLFDMSDIQLRKFTGVADPKDNGGVSKPITTSGKASGSTRSLGYLAIGDGTTDKSLITENFGDQEANQSALSQQKAYNELIETIRLGRSLPWVYMAIGALALIGIILLLRNRRTE